MPPSCASASGRRIRPRSCIARSCASSPTTPSRWCASRRSAASGSAGRIWPTSSRSAPAAPARRCLRSAERRKRLRELASLYEERLERPYEAIDTLERLLSEAAEEERAATETGHTPDNAELLGAHEALTRLYSRVGLWSKVVESLQRQAELTTDRQRARTLRMEVASVYEKELAGPERAIDAYEAILAEMPEDEEALAALDRLDETHGRFEDLAEILGKRAAAASGAERLELVRRRIRILEDRLNNPEAAASALRDLGNEAIADDELLAVMLRNLRRSGLAHEAARALSQRIEMEKAKGGADSNKRVSELNLELSLLKLDDLNDPAAARKGVEAALVASPDNPAALAALAQLHLKENDFASYYKHAPARGARAQGPARKLWRRCSTPAASRASSSSPRTRRAPASRKRWSRSPRTATRCGRCRRCSPARRAGTKRAACWNASWR